MPPAIEARGLTKRFGATTAVEAVDLAVARGEVFGLIGPGAAGKTTLVQLLAALLEPTAGTATVLGLDVFHDAPALRRRIGYVSQEFTLYGTLSVEENLDFFADLFGVPEAERERRKEALLAWSRLGPFRKRRAGRLSGGMQKKLHLCCTLVHEPEVLLLDEPTTGVDPVSRRELWEFLYDLVERGLTLVVATPYMDEAERCHRVALVHRGKVLRCDTPEALRAGVREAVFELRAPSIRPVHEQLGRRDLGVTCYLVGDRLHLLAPEGTDVAVLVRGLLPAAEAADLRVEQVAPTMEDVFISVVTAVDARPAARRPVPVSAGPAPATAGDLVVRLEGLSRTFGDFVAVDRLSLSVVRGEVFGFLGPNGSGKTTTIRMLLGLLAPSAGRGQVLGHDLGRRDRALRARIGYMSQRFSLYDDLTVAENLAFFGRGYDLPAGRLAERAAWVLGMAGLEGEARRRTRELSGGVRQRLALGCAILHEPEIVFLDEPTAGGDPLSRREFWDVIGAMASAGTTVFVTTHYLDEAEHCHRLALIHQGRLLAIGSPRALKDEMRAGTMLEVTCADPLRALRLLRGEPDLARASLFGRRLHVLVEDVALAESAIHRALGAARIAVDRLEPIPFSLEDLFVVFIDMAERRWRETDG